MRSEHVYGEGNLQVRADRAAMTVLGGLKKQLTAQMTEDGPVKAMEFCSTQAVTLTEELEKKTATGWSIKRVSPKNRNPDNALDQWDQQAWTQFETDSKLTYLWIDEELSKKSDVQPLSNPVAKRYYKPIRIEAACLHCHGTNIQPDLQSVLKERYPNDKATGYQMNQLRGLARVRIPN